MTTYTIKSSSWGTSSLSIWHWYAIGKEEREMKEIAK
jgi:hypothetical protein